MIALTLVVMFALLVTVSLAVQAGRRWSAQAGVVTGLSVGLCFWAITVYMTLQFAVDM